LFESPVWSPGFFVTAARAVIAATRAGISRENQLRRRRSGTGNIAVNLSVLAFSDTGSGKPIVFLHGLGLNRNFWSSTIAHLSPTHRCIAVDLPGHGESRDISCSGSMSAYAAHVREAIEKPELKDVTLVGHSMGGQIGIILALQMPSVITRLVLVCSAGIETFSPEEADKLKATMNSVYANPISDDVMQRSFPHINPEIRNLLAYEHVIQQKENFSKLSKLITSSVAGMLNEPVYNFLPGISQPTLVINGALDTSIPNRFLHPQLNTQQLLDSAKSKIKNCETVVFPMAGHYLPVDTPHDLANKIQNFA
jgi:pimeloyl-ACP methyl ester carboxylesterase